MTNNNITTKDGTQIFYKDWGAGQPIVFHHGWPLSGDDWDAQMMFFASKGYRVIAHDRRGHGRSSPSASGNDMNTYAADVAALTEHLGLRNAIHVGHSTGGGEVIRYVALYGSGGRVAKAVLIGAITPILMKTSANPDGVPPEVIDGIRKAVAGNRAQFYKDFSSGPFYGFNRPGATVLMGVSDNWVRQGMAGDIKAQYDCITAFSDRFHGRPAKDHGPRAGLAWRGRPDRAGRGHRQTRRQVAETCHAENLSGLSSWHGNHAGRCDQRRYAGFLPILIAIGGATIWHP